MYQRAITPGTDEKYADELSEIKARYASTMKEGSAFLARAKSLHDALEKYYIQAMDFGKVAQIKNDILMEFNTFAEVATTDQKSE
ncbi:MAG TPA: hypothetical protein VJ824_16715 [Bacillota bacterium]|nr:hypothetical protein [Bacillota bacterium]